MKKINIFAIISCFLILSNLGAQENYFFQYSQINYSSPTKSVTTEYHEWIDGEQFTLFTETNRESSSKIEREEEDGQIHYQLYTTPKLEDPQFPAYRNPANNYTIRTVVDPDGFLTQTETTVIKEEMYSFDWVITGEQKYIDSLLCFQAITEFRCQEFEVWYSPDIPINSGPFILHGLPGLIIEAAYYDGNRVFKLEYFGKLEQPLLSMEKLGFGQLNYDELPDHCDLSENYEDYLRILRAQMGDPDCTNCPSRLTGITWGECFDDCE